MATQKIERLLNLVIALLSTPGYLSAEWIHRNVVGYTESPTAEAFSRMFERDKNELRDLGIPLETGRVTQADTAEGYRIRRDAYELPDITLTAEEATAVAVATQLWRSPEWTTAAASAVLKLRAAGVDVDADGIAFSAPAGLPGLRGSEEALAVLLGAVETGRAVSFRHRSSPAVPWAQRVVEPWGVVTHRGRWYLVGHDRDREGVRTFRVSRIDEVRALDPAGVVVRPDDVDVRRFAADAVAAAEPGVGVAPVRVWLADGRANALRRHGVELADRELHGRSGQVLELGAAPREALVREIAGHGVDAVVLEPPDLRDEVVAILRAAASRAAETEGSRQ